MAINPLPRVPGLDVPIAPPPPRPDPSVWSNLASIGEVIGQERLRQRIGDIVASATDESGNVDQAKALAGLARAGLVTPEQLSRIGYQQQLLGQHAATQREVERANRESERLRGIEVEKPQYHFSVPDPVFGGGGVIEAPRRPGQPPIVHPWPAAPGAPAPAVTPGPQSALEPDSRTRRLIRSRRPAR